MRSAVIDIGTNTLLLLVVEPDGAGGLRPVVDLCRFGRLGQGLDASGVLAEEAITRSLAICHEYAAVMDAHQVGRRTVVGTQALREARNAAAFVTPAEALLGAPIEVIAGAREADLAFTAVARSFPALAGTPYVVVDVGGGSTELITTDGAKVVAAVSVPIGAVRLTERHLHGDPPTAAEIAALHADIDGRLAALVLPHGVPVIGTAGTATTMASLALALARYDAAAVTGYRLTPAAVAALAARLLGATVATRRELVGMVRERADVVAAGVAIFARIVARLDAPVMITCDRGIRWGVAYEQLGG
jgi:exopolyphosphatase/guanosine-5'-triphosphate,3'-diphosphate pyrophosphatase